MTLLPALSLALVAGWLICAWLTTRLPRRLHLRATWALVLAGVPVLGWLTALWGPGLGVAGLGLGLLILLGRPSRRPAAPAPGRQR